MIQPIRKKSLAENHSMAQRLLGVHRELLEELSGILPPQQLDREWQIYRENERMVEGLGERARRVEGGHD